MDMMAHKKKKLGTRLKYLAEQGDPNAREALNRSGFNRTPMSPAKPPEKTNGETLMRGHDVQERNDIPSSDMFNKTERNRTMPTAKAGVMPFQTQAEGEAVNRSAPAAKEAKSMSMAPHRKKIFARDPNYNPEPTTPAPTGPGTKQTMAVVGRPKQTLQTYQSGGPGGEVEGVAGPMKDSLHAGSMGKRSSSNFSHREQEYSGLKAPDGPGTSQTAAVTGSAKKSLMSYPGGGSKPGMQGGERVNVMGHSESHLPKQPKKRKLGRRGMAFIGGTSPGSYSQVSAVS